MIDKKLGKNAIDLTGQVFDLLTVKYFYGRTSSGRILWYCECVCGNTKIVSTLNLRQGVVKSCGCYRDNFRKTHGMSESGPYQVWKAVCSRTDNPNNPRWIHYGGRGITKCDKWKTFEGFWEDMSDGYSPELTIDRIDVNGNYCKENCRWTTTTVQNHNMRKKKGCSSKYKGVHFDKERHRYRVHIKINKKREYLGSYFSECDAARAYDNRSEELYGDRPNGTSR